MAMFSFADGVLPPGATLRRAAGPWSRTKRLGYTDFDLTSGVLPQGLTVQRAAGPWSRRSQTGLVEKGTTANVPRFDYDPPIENRVARSSAVSNLFILSATYTASQPDATTTKYVQGAVPLNGYAFDYFDTGAGGIGIATYAVDIRGDVGGEILWVCIQKANSGTTYKRVVLTTDWQRFELTSADTRYGGFGVRRLGDTGPDEASVAQTYYVRRRQLNRGSFSLAYAETTGTAIYIPPVCRGVMLEPSAVTSDGTRPAESFVADVSRGGATGSLDITYSDGSTETRSGTIGTGVLTLPASASAKVVSRVRVTGLLSGVMELGTEANVPRFDYDPITGALRGLLIEPSRTNLSPKSDGSVLTVGAGALAANVGTALDGSKTADRVVPDATAARHPSYVAARFGAGSFTLSGVVKADGNPRLGIRVWDGSAYRIRGTFDLSTGTIVSTEAGSLTIRPVGDGRYLVAGSGTSPSGDMGNTNGQGWVLESLPASQLVQGIFAGDGMSGTLISDIQIEAGLSATSRILTTGAAATRPAETLSLDWTAQGISNGLANVLYTFADGSMQMIEQQIADGVSFVPVANLNNYTIRSVSILQTPASRTITLGDKAPRSATLVDTGSRSATILT